MNSFRAQESRRQREQIEADEAARIAKPINEATAKAAKAHGQLIAEEKRAAIQSLRYKLTHEPSPEFATAPYVCDGHDSAEDITRKIQGAFTEWLETGNPLPSPEDASFVGDFIAANFQNADTTKASTFQSAYDFVMAAFAGLEQSYAPPVIETPVAPAGPFAEHDKLLVDLERQLAELPVGNSRLRENLERRLHKEQVTRELLGADSAREFLGEISTESGLVISSALSLQFANWLGSPIAARRFGRDRAGIRRAFAEFTGNSSFLSDEELRAVSADRSNDQCTSDQVKQVVGFRNDYGTRTSNGIRQ